MKRLRAAAAAVILIGLCSWQLDAQTPETRAITERLDAIEKQVAELNRLLRALLPPRQSRRYRRCR